MGAPDPPALIDWLDRPGPARRIATAAGALFPSDLVAATSLGATAGALDGRCVMVMAGDPLKTAAALIDLDGRARRLVLCPPDLEPRHWAAVIRDAGADALVHDADAPPPAGTGLALLAPCSLSLTPRAAGRRVATEWALLTSGTSGDPKMVVHTLATLTAAIAPDPAGAPVRHWATFYDIRRYGGLQILLRALAGRGGLTLRGAGESLDHFLARAGAAGVTHISGTPTHWRLVLMSPAARLLNPAYVRLSGEIADAALLDALRALYPDARVAHAFASTEAGVAFEVGDGRPGFPAALLEAEAGPVALKIAEGSLRIRSNRTALRYLGETAPPLRDAEGYVDTGDLIAIRDGRCHFVGRRGGIINVGGAKVNPEEVEAVISRHPQVRGCLVSGRRNPITGAVVAADVVLAEGVAATPEVRGEILALCAAHLAPHKAPALIRFVAALAVTAGGKLARRG
jgi:acyl-coenzyme A synthetase/AMP-(fatty) acid ligase